MVTLPIVVFVGMTDLDPPETEVRPVWCVIANVVDERPYGPGGAELRRGLKLFRPGAKVHVVDGFGGMGYETLTVVGQVRRSSRFSTVHVQTEHLTNWRVQLVYSPAVLRQIEEIRDGRGGFWLRAVTDPGSETYRDALLTVAERFRERTDAERPG
jgi:hypothetical protein